MLGSGGGGNLPQIGAQAVLLGIVQFNQAVSQVTRGLAQINSSTTALQTNSLLATSRATAGFANFSRGIGTASIATTTAMGAMSAAAIGVGAALASAAGAAVAASASFEKALKPSVVLGNFDTTQVDKLTTSILNLSRQWGVSTDTIAQGSAELVKSGIDFNALESNVLKAATALNVASDGELSMAESAKLLAQVLKAYNLPASEAGRISNIIAGATNNSTASFTEMRQGLGQTLALFAQFNIPLEEGIINLGLLNDANIRGERAGSAYRNLLLRMLDPAKDVAAVMLRYGISLQDTNGHLISARQFVERLSEAFSEQSLAARGLTEAEAASDLATLGMSRSLLGAATLARQGTAAFDKYTDAINKTDTNKIAEQFTDTTIKQVERLLKNINAIATQVGEPFNSALREGLKGLNAWFQTIDLEKLNAFSRMIKDDIGNAFVSVGNIIREQLSALESFLSAGASNTTSFVSNIDVSSYITAAQDVYNQAVAIINTTIAAVQQAFNDTVTFVTDIVQAVGATVNDLVNNAITIATGIVNTFSAIIAAVGETIGTVSNNVSTFMSQVLQRTATALQPLLDFLTTDVVNSAKPILEFIKIVIAVAIVAARIFQDLQTTNQSATKDTTEKILGLVFTFENLQKAVAQIMADLKARLMSVSEGTEFILQVMQIVLTEWTRQWREMGAVVATIFTWIGDRVSEFFNWLAQQPFIGEYVKGVITQFNSVKDSIGQVFTEIGALPRDIFKKLTDGMSQAGEGIQSTINSITENIRSVIGQVQTTVTGIGTNVQSAFDEAKKVVLGLIPDISAVATNAQDFFQRLIDGTKNALGTAVPAVQAYLEKIRAGLAAIQQQGTISVVPGVTGAGGSITPRGGGAGADVGFPVDQSEKMLRFIKTLLKDIPGVTDEFAKFIAELVQADPSRLNGIVDALKAQAPLLREILEARRTLLTTELAIEKTNQRIAILDLQMQRIDLQSRQAALPLEAKLLELKRQSLQLDQQMLPIQTQMAEIDRQIGILQRENYALTLRRLQLQQQALPIENKIADIDKQIAATQRVNYDLALAALKVQQEMAPIQRVIEDVEKKISRLRREDFNLTRQRLTLEFNIAQIDRQIADIDEQIAAAQRENFDLTDQRLRTELAMLPIKTQISSIDKQIAAVQQTNYDLSRRRAQADLDALPIKQRIADLERQITDSVDKQQQLELRRTQLLAQHGVDVIQRQLDATNTKLEQLWAQFSLGPTTPFAASLVPEIIASEAEKARLERLLKPAQIALDTIKNTTEDINFQNELTQIALEQQKLAQEAILRPIQDRIDALAREQDETAARNAVTLAGLEQQKQFLENLLVPMQEVLDSIDAQNERQKLLNDITINGLNRQKQLLQDLKQPYTEQLNRLIEMQKVTEFTNAIAETFLQEELQRLHDILAPMEDRLEAIRRDQDAYSLRNEIVRTGLEKEKQGYQDLLLPIQNAIDAIDRERAAEDLRKAIAVAGLELQKSRLQEILDPLEKAKLAVEAQTRSVELQRDLVVNAYDQMKLKLEALKLSEEIYKNTLEQIRLAEQTRLGDLIARYQDALVKSGAFTSQEAADAVIRLGLWDGEKTKVAELEQKIKDLNTALGNTAGGFNPLPASVNNTENNMRILRDTLGDANSGLNKNLALLATTIGTSGSGVTLALKNLETAAGAASTPFTNINTAIVNLTSSATLTKVNTLSEAIGGGPGAFGTGIELASNVARQGIENLYGRIEILTNDTFRANLSTFGDYFSGPTYSIRYKTDQAKDGVNLIGEAINTLSGGATQQKILDVGNRFHGIEGGSLSWAIIKAQSEVITLVNLLAINLVAGAIFSGIENLRQRFSGSGSSLERAAQLATAEMDNLRRSIENVATAQGTLNLVTAKYIATQAAATAIAIRQPGNFSASQIYTAVRDVILGGQIGFAEGGYVPGPRGAPMLATVHGGEYIVPVNREPTAVQTGSTWNYYNNIVNNYNFSARYEKMQDPITLSADVRAVIELSKR